MAIGTGANSNKIVGGVLVLVGVGVMYCGYKKFTK